MQRQSISVYFITVITAKIEKYWKCEFCVMICTLLAMFRHLQWKHLPKSWKKLIPFLQKNFKIKIKCDEKALSWQC